MFILSSNITVSSVTSGDKVQLPIITLEIDKSRKTLTNTAKITLPRNIFVMKNGAAMRIQDVPALLVPGSKIQIQIGYDGYLNTEFTGYISQVSASIPIEIKCEDEMWTLKQNSFTTTWGTVTKTNVLVNTGKLTKRGKAVKRHRVIKSINGVKIADIVNYIYPGNSVVVDLEIDGFVAVNESTAQILERFTKFGLQCYFGADSLGNKTLYVDFAFALHGSSNHVKYNLYQNVISNDLMYNLKKDARIHVIGISNLANGKKIKISAGDTGGETHTLNYYNMSESELQKIVAAEINHLRYEGYKFSFKTFGVPLINPGDVAVITDPIYPEHDGSFLIESVITNFGIDGFRRDVHPEIKLA